MVLAMLGALLTVGATPSVAADSPSVHFVVDVSGSMSGSPLAEAKEALATAVVGIPSSTAVGLRSYAGGCGDGGVLRVPVALDNRDEFTTAVNGLVAGGGTPTDAALAAGVSDLPDTGDRTLVLISDGQSGCGDPCAVAAGLVATEDVAFTVHTVGFNSGGVNAPELQCIADVSGGDYFEVDDSDGLVDAIGTITPTVKNLVVLGDSFSSGEGTFDYYADTTQGLSGWTGCHRSDASWGELLALSSPDLEMVGFFACSGEK